MTGKSGCSLKRFVTFLRAILEWGTWLAVRGKEQGDRSIVCQRCYVSSTITCILLKYGALVMILLAVLRILVNEMCV